MALRRPRYGAAEDKAEAMTPEDLREILLNEAADQRTKHVQEDNKCGSFVYNVLFCVAPRERSLIKKIEKAKDSELKDIAIDLLTGCSTSEMQVRIATSIYEFTNNSRSSELVSKKSLFEEARICVKSLNMSASPKNQYML